MQVDAFVYHSLPTEILQQQQIQQQNLTERGTDGHRSRDLSIKIQTTYPL